MVTDTCSPRSPTGLDDDCNGIDEDCDGTADNHFFPYQSICGVGACLASGQVTCQNGVEYDTCIPGIPSPEICGNDIDEDCNGADLTCPPCGEGLITGKCQCGAEPYETGYCCSGYHQVQPCQNPYPEDETRINYLTPEAAGTIDDVTNQYRNKLNYARVGIVYNGTIVYTKSYKDDSVDVAGQWASISKPGTAMITMQLREQGIIDSIDDNIWDYSSKYIDCMPPPWENSPLTIKHLLLHQSGVPYTAPLWSGNHLDLRFEPGTDTYYTSGGFGIVGDVIRTATGKGYDTLVHEYLADPVGAPSITSPDQSDAQSERPHSDWQAPGTWVSSTVEDLAKFSAGVMNHIYVSKEVLENEMLFEYTPNMGLGWMVAYENDILYALHTGDNGSQKSVLVIDVTNKMSVSILFSDRIDMTDNRIPWAIEILNELKTFENPIQAAPACPGFCCESLCHDPILGTCSIGTCCAQQISCAPEDCGNGICDPGDCHLCSLDCDISQCMGDGYCSTDFMDGNENCGNSPSDCSCSSPEICCNDACIEPSCYQDSDCGSDMCKIYTCNDAGSCTASCSSVDITQCMDGDGCCPSACNSQNDSDCTGFNCNALELLLDMDSSVEDRSINDIICTVIGATHTANGKFGGAFSFDGNDYIDCGTDPNLNINDELTITAWFNPNVLRGSTRTLVGKFDSDTDTHGYTLFWQTSGNSLEFDVGNGTGFSRAQLTGYTDLDSWHHVAGVFDGGTLKIYVDGVLQDTTPYTDSIADENDPLRIGANSGALNRYWNGLIDEVSVWSRALSQEEIEQLQTQPIPCGQ